MVCFFIFLVLLPHLSCFSFPPLILYLPVRTFHLILAPSFSLLNHMASHCWWCTVLWCMDFGGSFVWCHRAIDSGGGGRRGGDQERGGGQRGGGQPPPHGLLGEGVEARRWAWGRYWGSQHIVLPSQPVWNLSHTCNGWWKKDFEERKGEEVEKKEQLEVFSDFFPWFWQMKDQSSPRPFWKKIW